jgi:protein-tyrosine phosphatase
MAEAILAAALPDMSVSSVGIGALIGYPADETAQQLMVARGLDISGHRARQASREIVLRADMILVMDHKQRKYLEDQYPATTGKIFRLCEFSKSDVPDPYRKSQSAFEDSLALIDEGVAAWAPRIKKIYSSAQV